jgi:hypothetical protein
VGAGGGRRFSVEWGRGEPARGIVEVQGVDGGLRGDSLHQSSQHAAGTDLHRAVKTTVFLADMGLFGKVNEVYARHFREPFPARSTVQVAALPKGVSVEIDVVAEV